MTSTGMPGGETTDGATQTGTEVTSVSVTDVANTETTVGQFQMYLSPCR
jgi:hypothetical protein